MSRYTLYILSLFFTVGMLLLSFLDRGWMWGAVIFGLLAAVGTVDLLQRRSTLRRNYPILAHFRYGLESIGPEMRQYFIESDTTEVPFSRQQRALGVDGRLLISTYPTRAKTRNLQRDPDCAVLVFGGAFDAPWVQVYGTAEVLTGERGVEALVAYYRAAAGEHDDWEEYRQAMRDREKVCIVIDITDWGPIATGGVPPEFAD